MLIFGKTDVGIVRANNQDTYEYKYLNEDCCFAVVCDGMGGENGGQIASEIASKTIYNSVVKNFKSDMTPKEYKHLIITAISEGNVAVYDESLKHKELLGMGTTAVFVMKCNNKAYVAHVGDSRVYLLKNDNFMQITKDHSVIQTLMEQGKITPEEAKTHPQRSMITRCVGISCFVDIDYIEITQIENSKFLLCSDGLTNSCSDAQIKEILQNNTNDKICDLLINSANDAGGTDNITAVLMV